MAKATQASPADDFAATIAAALADEEFVALEKDGEGGDFNPTHDFHENPVLKGTYSGDVKVVETVNGKRNIHTFSQADGYEGPVEIWGSKILDEDLPKVTGMRCAVVFHGKVKNYNKFEVLPAKSAVARAAR